MRSVSFPSSSVHLLGPLAGTNLGRVEDEVPLHGATPTFARAHGGPITRAFVDALPPHWQAAAIVHSSLVWLTPGLAHDEAFGPDALEGPQRDRPPFRHEAYPGWNTGARGATNRHRGRKVRSLFVGDPGPEFAVGCLPLEAAEDPAFWHPMGSYEHRDQRLLRWLAEGRLQSVHPPAGWITEHGHGAFFRPRAAARSGFHFTIRAHLGDACLPSNALRNQCML